MSIAETITAVFKTNYQVDFPYDPQELFIYALIGYDSIVWSSYFIFMTLLLRAASLDGGQVPDHFTTHSRPFQWKMARAFT